MRDGRKDKVNPVYFTNDDRVDFIGSFLTDERSAEEWSKFAKHLLYIIDNTDDDISTEAEEALLNLEAIVAYESGEFHGNEYFSEVYWDNYKKYYEWDRKRA